MKKRVWSVALLLCMVLTLLPGTALAADVVASGTCGETVTWSLDSNGVLTVSGTGTVEKPDGGVIWGYDYPDLQKVCIEDGITGIGNNSFKTCPMTTVEIPKSVTSIGSHAFAGCSRLQRVVLPDGIPAIPDNAFFACFKLTSIVIPDSVTSIGNSAFSNCISLVSIPVPDGVTSIGEGAFSGCDGLRSMTFPEGVSEIGAFTFEYCERLTDVTIAKSVTAIGEGAFYGCLDLADVYYTGSEDECAAVTVGEGNEEFLDATLHTNSVGPKITLYTMFSDMPAETNWAYHGIAFCVAGDLMNGVGDGRFDPNGTLTRAMVATILWRKENAPEATKPCTFTDLTMDWYKDAVAWAAEAGVVTGRDAATFDPDGAITRQDLATMLYRYARYKNPYMTPAGDLSGFPDSGKVAGYAQAAMAWANASGIIVGNAVDGVSYLDPLSNATRAQVATIFMRFEG